MASATRVLICDRPNRAIALVTTAHALIFKHGSSSSTPGQLSNSSTTSLGSAGSNYASGAGPRCIVELVPLEKADLSEYRTLSQHNVHGTLGLITVDNDVFLCVVSGASRVATVRPTETVERILSVDFHCLNRPDYDHILNDEVNFYTTDGLDEDDPEHGQNVARRDVTIEHPCMALRKLLSGGSFYYSTDFDLTSRLQERTNDASTSDFESFDQRYLWNSYMIKPLVDFRSRLSNQERAVLDSTHLITSAIRGFALTMPIPAHSSPARSSRTGLPSTLTLISRLSCRRAGTRFNARGIDDDGNVANFVETETVFWSPSGVCFSYVQLRGSVPVFWEQTPGLLPAQQKVQLTRSPQATQPAFDKHFEDLEVKYGPIHIVNLLSKDKPSEVELSARYQGHVSRCSLNHPQEGDSQDHGFLKETNYDFHAETRERGYEAAKLISHYIQDSADAFGYCLMERIEDHPNGAQTMDEKDIIRSVIILQQQGAFRTNCLDCLDRTNLVQTIISNMAIEAWLAPRGERPNSDLFARHGILWADNGDALSRIYAGTGALKSSFTRHGKMSLAGALADARKSATRMYINNFSDKGRQITIDILLGRHIGQAPVYLFDPINDYVTNEISRRASEYSSTRDIQIWAGTFNLNGRATGINEDLSLWLCPNLDPSRRQPHIVAVGFQEIVELSPQQIMSTEPNRRQDWERAVKRTLNNNARASGSQEYVLLRGGQLVGASLSIFVKVGILNHIKNVEGSLKKTGMSGMAGNKGAVAIRMEMENTNICFVTAHLAAGFANYEERNRDYKTINHGLKFQRHRSIEDHDTVIWLGDFNYRIGLSHEKALNFVKAGNLERLYENDQLNLQMLNGLTFPHFSEARITFPPTYKYDVGSDEYDTSEKARIPAWTDRILRKGDNLRQTDYNSAPLRFSDHRPVYALFSCTINVVDEKVKDQLSKEIYSQRRSLVGDSLRNTNGEDTDDEDLLGYEAIEPGLPPASSDKRKWWLDNSLPARSRILPPFEGLVPNPGRPSNPFSSTNAPDWIPNPKAKIAARNGWQTGLTTDPQKHLPPSTMKITTRNLPPPFNPPSSSSSSTIPARNGTSTSPPTDTPARERSTSHPSTASIPSTPTLTRKPAPPIPKKPPSLASDPSPPPKPTSPRRHPLPSFSIADPTPSTHKTRSPVPPPRTFVPPSAIIPAKKLLPPQSAAAAAAAAAATAMAPSPPRARRAVGLYGMQVRDGNPRVEEEKEEEEEEEKPALPARRGMAGRDAGMGLMDMDDEGGEGGVGVMSGWEVLKPG